MKAALIRQEKFTNFIRLKLLTIKTKNGRKIFVMNNWTAFFDKLKLVWVPNRGRLPRFLIPQIKNNPLHYNFRIPNLQFAR